MPTVSIMELAYTPSIPVCLQITSQTNEYPWNPRSTTYHTPWTKSKSKPARGRSCPVRIIQYATSCRPHPPLMGHDVWGNQRKMPPRNIGLLVPCQCATSDSSGAGGDGGNKHSTEAALNLYTAIKNVQVMTFVSSLLTAMGKNIEFVIQPTPMGGMNAGMNWKLELDRTLMPFGKGLSLSMVQVCTGKAFIRNADTFIEPIFHGMEPILLKWAAFLGPIVGRVSPIIKHRRTRGFIYCLLTVVTMSALLTILKGALL